MKTLLCLSVLALSAAALQARSDVAHHKHRRLQAIGSEPKPYVVRVSPDALQYVESILIPYMQTRSDDPALPAFLAELHRKLQGLAFTGYTFTLSPEAYAYVSQLPFVSAIEEDIMLHGLKFSSQGPLHNNNNINNNNMNKLKRELQASPVRDPAQAPAFTQDDAPEHLDRIDSRRGISDDQYFYTNTGAGVDVYVVDSGINLEHEEFAGRLVAGFNAVPDQAANDVSDCNGHGTHVAGLAAGTTYGTAKEATIVPVRIYGCDNSGPLSQALDGINWVIERIAASGRRAVVNMSFGGARSGLLDFAVDRIVNVGGVVIAAAGNEAADACGTSPAGAPSSFAVASSDRSDKFADFSNYGSCVDIIAPGRSIKSAWIGGEDDTKTLSGTSMSTGIVSGAAAQFLQANPDAAVSEVYDGLRCSATAGVIEDIPTASTTNLFLYTPPGGFGGKCVTSGAAAHSVAVAALVVLLAALYV